MKQYGSKSVTSNAANVEISMNCVACKKDKLYACQKFKGLGHEEKVTVLKTNGLCMNCMRPGHYMKDCASSHRCKRCQRPGVNDRVTILSYIGRPENLLLLTPLLHLLRIMQQ